MKFRPLEGAPLPARRSMGVRRCSSLQSFKTSIPLSHRQLSRNSELANCSDVTGMGAGPQRFRASLLIARRCAPQASW